MPDDVKEPVDLQAEEGKQLDAAMARYEGHFIESADLMQRSVTLTINGVVPPGVEKDKNGKGKVIEKAILSFDKTSKRFILGKTNERILKAIHGKKASGWIGKPVTLCVRYLPEAFGEKWVPTCRVMPPSNVPLPMNCRKHFGLAKPGGDETT
jgi:hypothetical protein